MGLGGSNRRRSPIQTLRALSPYLRRYRAVLISGFLCIASADFFTALAPWVLRYAIDALSQSPDGRTLARYAGWILGVALCQAVFRFGMRRAIVGTSRWVEYDLRNDLFGHLQRLHPLYFQQSRTGDLMARMTNDLEAIRMFLGFGLMFFTEALILFPTSLILMASIHWRLTILALLPLPVLSVVVNRISSKVHRRFMAIQEHFATINTHVQENLSGIRVVKAYAQEANQIARFAELSREYVERNRALIRVRSLFFPMMMLFSGSGVVIILWLGGQEVIGGRISLGEFVAFNGYLLMLTFPMIVLGWVVDLFQRGAASMKRIKEVLDAQPEIEDGEGALDVRSLEGRIEFRGVGLTYPQGGVQALRGVDLVVEPGTTVAIVGHTGAGKSTLVRLIPRLIQTTAGQVLIDGLPIERIPLEVLRAHVGYVPQETFLFSETIAQNIAYGLEAPQEGNTERTEATEKQRNGFSVLSVHGQIADAAEIAQIGEEILRFPQGFDTVLGERGVTLSGGQKQRTALSRAIVRDPKILILDDAFSSVDTYTEERILKGLAAVLKGRTNLIVSHRISTVKDADWIVVLEDGQIVEQGRHETLAALGGIYADLYQRQLLAEELEQM